MTTTPDDTATDEELIAWAKETGRLIEYLPGVWVTPMKARALFAGGPILSEATTRKLISRLTELAAALEEMLP